MNDDMMLLKDFAAMIGLAESSVRQKCQRGNVAGAVKIGRDWFIPRNCPYDDHRKRGMSKRWQKEQE